MYKHEYQGGSHVEVFSAQGKDPVLKWKLTGGAGIRKIYDRDTKGYVYSLEGTSTTTRMQCPKDAKQTLMLMQRYLVMQMFIPLGQDFSVEIGTCDLSNVKRRILLSTTLRDIQSTPLHARLPLTIVRRAVWINLAIDMNSVVGDVLKRQSCKHIENLTVCANCKLRRIYTMKSQPLDTTLANSVTSTYGINEGEVDTIHKNYNLPADIPQCTQVLTIERLRSVELSLSNSGTPRSDRKAPSISSEESDFSSNRGLLPRRNSKEEKSPHIAFGSKFTAPEVIPPKRKALSAPVRNVSQRGGSAGRTRLAPLRAFPNPPSSSNGATAVPKPPTERQQHPTSAEIRKRRFRVGSAGSGSGSGIGGAGHNLPAVPGVPKAQSEGNIAKEKKRTSKPRLTEQHLPSNVMTNSKGEQAASAANEADESLCDVINILANHAASLRLPSSDDPEQLEYHDSEDEAAVGRASPRTKPQLESDFSLDGDSEDEGNIAGRQVDTARRHTGSAHRVSPRVPSHPANRASDRAIGADLQAAAAAAARVDRNHNLRRRGDVVSAPSRRPLTADSPDLERRDAGSGASQTDDRRKGAADALGGDGAGEAARGGATSSSCGLSSERASAAVPKRSSVSRLALHELSNHDVKMSMERVGRGGRQERRAGRTEDEKPYDHSKYEMDDLTASYEAHMLKLLQTEQLEEQNEAETRRAEDYDEHSGATHTLFEDSMGSSSGAGDTLNAVSVSTMLQQQEQEEMLDLLYDPTLNCYFDPNTCKYYELA
ncbi:PREDICTED: uncharacterized protein C3orf67 homolog [Priapulus caudatus]|uniref:Uncharacterized protein C3orf67 homolog n=1 Tax=Priapulus caudatus TaxID=37621 RepID=A0ABM1EVE8_PRICU|nr:PREDICTED: uncharacterized protein C3orf67 homolog [Priapulus caudatus]